MLNSALIGCGWIGKVHNGSCQAAVAASKAVLCEKPVDLDLNRAGVCRGNSLIAGQ